MIQAVPALQSRFLAYGSRATSSSSEDAAKEVRPSAVDQLLDYVASFRVPHNYFTHFYVVSVGSSLYWLWNLRHISAPQDWHLSDLFSCDAYAVSTAQVQLLWVLMFLQGVRRLSESYAYTSSSKSGMWFGHWVLGILFYLATNMAIWTENLPVSRVDFDLGRGRATHSMEAGHSHPSNSHLPLASTLVPCVPLPSQDREFNLSATASSVVP